MIIFIEILGDTNVVRSKQTNNDSRKKTKHVRQIKRSKTQGHHRRRRWESGKE